MSGTAARILYAPKWKDTPILKIEEWMEKVMELAEMVKLIKGKKTYPVLFPLGNRLWSLCSKQKKNFDFRI